MADADWSLLETFVRVAEAGSLTAGARALGISQPTAGRHVAELEEQLGLTLFVRHSRGLALSERGAELFQLAQELDGRVKELLRQASGSSELPRGTVRISANEPLGVLVLGPCFARLRCEHPEINLELVIDNSVSNLSRREADVAVRMFRPSQMDLVAQHVGDIELGFFARRDYLQQRGSPDKLEQAAGLTLIGADQDPMFLNGVAAMGMKPGQFGFRCDNIISQVQAVLDGVGVGGMHRSLALQHPELVEVPSDVSLPDLPVWLVMHRDLRGVPAVRTVFSFLGDFLADYTGAA